jgi:hypothetical protein
VTALEAGRVELVVARPALAFAPRDGRRAVGRTAGNLVDTRLAGEGVVWKLKMVDSWPPCWVAELQNTLPTLPTSLPCAHSPPVASRNWRICPTMLPKRVGVPKTIASASLRSATVATGTSTKAFCASTAPMAASTSGGKVSGTRFKTTSTPATSRAPPAMAWAMR